VKNGGKLETVQVIIKRTQLLDHAAQSILWGICADSRVTKPQQSFSEENLARTCRRLKAYNHVSKKPTWYAPLFPDLGVGFTTRPGTLR
jgi:hypothetical protein